MYPVLRRSAICLNQVELLVGGFGLFVAGSRRSEEADLLKHKILDQ